MPSVTLYSRTRRVVASLTACVFATAMLSCSDSKRTVEPDGHYLREPAGGIDIGQVRRDDVGRAVVAQVNVGGESRSIRIASSETKLPVPGITATMMSDAGTTLAQLTIAWLESTGEVWIVQEVDGNRLSARVQEYDGRLMEEYEANGDRIVLSHAKLDHEQMSKAAAKYQKGELSLTEDPGMLEIETSFARFDEFAANHPEWAAANQGDWSALLSVLSDASITGVLPGGDDPQRVDGLSQRTCLALVLCATIACSVPLLGFACVPCLGGTVACAIMEAICWFARCDCCF